MNKANHLSQSLSIIGLGPMGQAMSRVYLEKGFSVTAWNRTKSKAEALVSLGSRHAVTIEEAVQANQVIMISLTDYQLMFQAFEGVTAYLDGKILVNLSSDTPESARKAAKWAIEYGADFISGGIMADPPMVGKPEAYVFYSGERAVFELVEPVLEVLGKVYYLGKDHGLSQLYYQALLNIMFTNAAAVAQSLALVKSAGVEATAFEPHLNDFLGLLPYFLGDMAKEADSGKYDGDQNNMHMMTAGMNHVFHASHDAKISTALPEVIKDIFNKTVASGYGKAGLSSIIEVLKKTPQQ